MPHQCVHCNKVYPDGSKELLEGCSCGSHFFFYIRQEQLEKLNEKPIDINLNEDEKKRIEQDVRDMIMNEDEDMPVVLDLESIRVLKPGKFVIDIANLFNSKKPIIYKLEEGKYVVDLASTLKKYKNEKNT
jgi:uncharacterized protein